MNETTQKRIIPANHWLLKLAFGMGVFFAVLIVVGEILAQQTVVLFIAALLGKEIDLSAADHHFPLAGVILSLSLLLPVMLGQAQAAMLAKLAVSKIPSKS